MGNCEVAFEHSSRLDADWIIGRATRVWEVRKVGPSPEHPNDRIVLKDLWMEVTPVSEIGIVKSFVGLTNIWSIPISANIFALHAEGMATTKDREGKGSLDL